MRFKSHFLSKFSKKKLPWMEKTPPIDAKELQKGALVEYFSL